MSVQLAIYDIATGDILRRVVCSESVATRQAREGEAILEVERGIIFTDATHFVDLSGGKPELSPI